MLTPAMPTVQARVPPSGSLVQRQKLGRRKLLVMAPQMLIFVGCMPSPVRRCVEKREHVRERGKSEEATKAYKINTKVAN
jgi:hypothetical protein